MSATGQANDTFIGRLFRRISPGSSYAAFPWKSWDRVCTILETIRGRGVRVRRSTNEGAWELDALSCGVLDRPDAYSVYVNDPGGEWYDPTELPSVMASDEGPTVYCYLPCPRGAQIAGANSLVISGEYGDTADIEYPDGSRWGWKAIGALESDDPRVVYGIVDLANGSFGGITIDSEDGFVNAVEAEGQDADTSIVPIAWVSGTNVVQTLLGRPWKNDGEVVPCKVVSGGDWSKGVTVDLYPDGFSKPAAARTSLFFPEVGTHSAPQQDMAILAHRFASFVVQSSDPSEVETEQGN